MSENNLKLRIELNASIKFYLRISNRSLLVELRKLINNVLRRNYQINLKSYAIRDTEGFELVDGFKLGDILEDNQILIVDPFSYSALLHSKSSKAVGSPVSSHVDRNEESEEQLFKEDIQDKKEVIKTSKRPQIVFQPTESPIETEIKPVKRGIKIIPTEGIPSSPIPIASSLPIESSPVPTPASPLPSQDVKKAKGNKASKLSATNVEVKDTENTLDRLGELVKDSDIKTEEKNTNPEDINTQEISNEPIDTKLVEKVKVTRKESVKGPAAPTRPEKFQGFVVNKADVTKMQFSVQDASSFRPLKKRVLDEAIELNLDDLQ